MYKLSVIVPTYNAEKYLLDAVNSIINQSIGFDNIELILVDDNSIDGTRDIIKELSHKYKNIVPILMKDNSGSPSRPRNIGIKKSSSDYIMFLDNDDFYYKDMCKKMYSNIVFYDADIVICRYKKFINSHPKKLSSFLDSYEDLISVNSIDEFPELMTSDFPTMVWNKIFKKEFIISNNIMFPEKDLYEDVYFSVKSFLYSKGIVLLNDFWGYGWQIRKKNNGSNSTSHTFVKENLIKQFNGLLKIFSLLNNNDKFNILKGEMLVGWTKLFLFTKLDISCQIKLLNKVKPFYKEFKINTRLKVVSLHLNLIINIIIKIFSVSILFPILISKIFSFFYKFRRG